MVALQPPQRQTDKPSLGICHYMQLQIVLRCGSQLLELVSRMKAPPATARFERKGRQNKMPTSLPPPSACTSLLPLLHDAIHRCRNHLLVVGPSVDGNATATVNRPALAGAIEGTAVAGNTGETEREENRGTHGWKALKEIRGVVAPKAR